MFQILFENILLTIIIITLMLLSIIGQVLIGVIYQKLINEAENLSTTENKHLKLCKLKFQNCYQLNGNVPNISVFVDKFISRLMLFRLSLNSLRRLSSQLMMLAVFTSGVGASIGIISGETMFRLLPYYILAIVGLYIYYSVAALVDIPGRREALKINLMDHLENHLLSRLKNSEKIAAPVNEAAGKEKIVTIPLENKSKPVLDYDPRPATPAQSAPPHFSEDEIEELLQELIV
ncbi:MAG: hypothetical protein FWE14_06240 [Lachnospiraceae bacterium]|nr:hypothetical protein [Lachnospiraceae bacterium]